LLHVSQIAREHVEKPSDILKVGDVVTAKIVDFNEADHKISLSMKALLPPETEEAAPVEADAPAESEASVASPVSEEAEAVAETETEAETVAEAKTDTETETPAPVSDDTTEDNA
jgi:ribosomal protein S1